MGFDNKLATPRASSSKPLREKHIEKQSKKSSHMCDCNKENQSDPQNESDSAQTDDGRGIGFGALIGGMMNSIGDMLDGVGPWLPYIGGSALLIMLLGYMANNVDSFLGMFESDFKKDKAPSIQAANEVSRSSLMAPNKAPGDSCGEVIEEAPAGQNEGYQTEDPCKCSLKVRRHKIKWPE